MRLDFKLLRPFTIYPNRIMQRHPTPLQVITTRARDGGPKEHSHKQEWPRETFCYICTRALHSFLSFAHCRAASNVIPLLPKATFTPSFQPNLGLPCTLTPLTSSINTLLATRYSTILSTSQTISILSYLLYLLTPFLFQLSYASLHS